MTMTDREEILEKIRDCSLTYTPEWRFHTGKPDMGTMLALLFADMMGETRNRLKQMPQVYRLQFYRMFGAELLPPEGAKGYVTFSMVSEEVPGIFVEKGEKVLGKTEEGGTVSFATEEDLYVSPARLSGIFYTDGDSDFISAPLSLPLCLPPADNQQSHTFYIAHDTVFSIQTEGEIALHFQLPPNRRGRELESILQDQVQWSYYSPQGFVEFPVLHCEQGTVFLKKEQNMPAFDFMELQGVDSLWIRMEIPSLPPQSEVVFPALTLGSSGSSLPPETIWDGNMELDQECFFPFGEKPYPFAEVYISSEEVFSKKGAEIQLDFELSFVDVPGDLVSPEVPVEWRTVMHQSDFEKPTPPDIVISSVVWEYYNGAGWKRLPVAEKENHDTRFGLYSSPGSVSVRFLCPDDIEPFLLSGQEGRCIRIRISRMENLYAPEGIYRTPQIKCPLLHYVYGAEGMPPVCAFAGNQMRMKRLDCRREFVPFQNTLRRGKVLYLSFSRPIREQGIHLLFILGNGMEKGAGYQYEYCGEDGWRPLKTEDETQHLSRTGLIALCGEHAFAEKEFFGLTGYWMRIVREDGTGHGEGDFPVIRAIFPNSITVAAQGESGEDGNLPAGAVDTMERNIGFISGVTNPERMVGGCEGENREQAVARMASTLRHRKRAVTAKDYEDIVYGGFRKIRQVRCFPGKNERGESAPGHVTLVVLVGQEEEQEPFAYWEPEILRYLRPHMDYRLYEEGRFHIVEPEWVRMDIHMEICVEESVRLNPFRDALTRRICSFLDPATGNFDGGGWRIGTLPTVHQIENLCSQQKEVLYVRNISLKDEREYGCYGLGISGEHEMEFITV